MSDELHDVAFFYALEAEWSDAIAFGAGAAWALSWVKAFEAMGDWVGKRCAECGKRYELPYTKAGFGSKKWCSVECARWQ